MGCFSSPENTEETPGAFSLGVFSDYGVQDTLA